MKIFLVMELGLLFANFYLESIVVKVRKVAKISNRYNQVPHLTQDTTWESDKNTIKQGPRGQYFAQKVTIRQQLKDAKA